MFSCLGAGKRVKNSDSRQSSLQCPRRRGLHQEGFKFFNSCRGWFSCPVRTLWGFCCLCFIRKALAAAGLSEEQDACITSPIFYYFFLFTILEGQRIFYAVWKEKKDEIARHCRRFCSVFCLLLDVISIAYYSHSFSILCIWKKFSKITTQIPVVSEFRRVDVYVCIFFEVE